MTTTRTFSYTNESREDGSSVKVFITRDDDGFPRDDDGFPVSLVVDNGNDEVGAVALTTDEALALARALRMAAYTADANDADDDDDDCGECPDDVDFSPIFDAPAILLDQELERREDARFDAALLRSYNEDGDDVIDFDVDDEDA
jgi:hypothetical protein